MDGLFLYLLLGAIVLALLLFLPIALQTNLHYDANRKKFAFAVYLYKHLKILGGYVSTYQGGLALHLSPKKAVIVPYEKLNSERKRFSFMRTFRLITLRTTVETGADYLLAVALINSGINRYFVCKYGNGNTIENNLWLTDGDVFRFSLHGVVAFNLWTLLINFYTFLKGKLKTIWQKKMKKCAI